MPFFKKLFSKSLKSSLLKGSLILFLGTTIGNFGSYLFHLSMGRMLGPADYGVLASLISLTYLISIISGTLSTAIVKFITRYKAKEEYAKIFHFWISLTKAFLILGVIIFVLFALNKRQISNFLNISQPDLIVVVAIWMLLNFVSFINESALRGFFEFNFLSLYAVLVAFIKVGLGILLVSRGFSVAGALWAVILSLVVPYLISFYPLGFLWQYRNQKVKIAWKSFYSYSFPVFFSTLGLYSLYSTDVILVKHFFPPFEAGLYSGLSVMGKIVFFASGVVTVVMFPLVSEKFERGENHREIFLQSLLVVGFISLGVTGLYLIFPKLMISLLYGKSYLSISSYLGYFALFISSYSLISLFINYYLSIKKTFMGFLPLAAAVVQVVLICFFHKSISQVITSSLAVCTLLLLILLLYYFQNEGKQ